MKPAALFAICLGMTVATESANAQFVDLFRHISPAVVVLHTVQRGVAPQLRYGCGNCESESESRSKSYDQGNGSSSSIIDCDNARVGSGL